MKLLDLIQQIPGEVTNANRIDPDLVVNGLQYDSRKVKPGDLFFAVAGYQTDGRGYIADAAAHGAVAVVLEGDHAVPLPAIRVRGIRRAMALLSAAFYGRPAGTMQMIAITGTAGKTTTSYLLRSILDRAGRRTGLLGTISYWVLDRQFPAPNTTPESLDLQRYLAQMRDAGADTVVMEASSHGIELHRVEGIDWAAAVFTNFSQDHLDFHGDMDTYLRAKLRLFEGLAPGATAVINADDPALELVRQVTKAHVLSFGIDAPADVSATEISEDIAGSRFTLRLAGRALPVALPLVGRHNIANALAAAAAAQSCGIDSGAIVAGLTAVTNVPGRFEKVDAGQDFTVVVDYAHTPEELERLLAAAQKMARARIITVFGCGGDRDRGKRPLMGRAAARWSDEVIVTSDNPRTEDPASIISDILPGLGDKPYNVRVDRREAIAEAIEQARANDLVIIAGKGHEDYQIIGSQKHHFDDREVAMEALRCLRGKD